MKTAKSAKKTARSYNAALSRREVALLAGWERERRLLVSLDDIRRTVGTDAASDVAWRLVRKKALERVGAGKYLLRPLRTMNRPTASSSAVMAAALLQDERYYLGGLWALTFHRLTEQQYTSTLDAFVARRLVGRRLGGTRLVFHRLSSERLGYGIVEATIEGATVHVGDPERTLLDLLDHPTLAGTGAEALRHVQEALPRLSLSKLVDYAVRGSRSSTCQRLGLLLERGGASARLLAPLRKRVRMTRSMLSLRPGYPRKGTFNQRWLVVENDA